VQNAVAGHFSFFIFNFSLQGWPAVRRHRRPSSDQRRGPHTVPLVRCSDGTPTRTSNAPRWARNIGATLVGEPAAHALAASRSVGWAAESAFVTCAVEEAGRLGDARLPRGTGTPCERAEPVARPMATSVLLVNSNSVAVSQTQNDYGCSSPTSRREVGRCESGCAVRL